MKEYYGSEGTRKDKENPFLSIISTTPGNISSKCGIFCTFYDDDVTYVIQEGYDDQILSQICTRHFYVDLVVQQLIFLLLKIL